MIARSPFGRRVVVNPPWCLAAALAAGALLLPSCPGDRVANRSTLDAAIDATVGPAASKAAPPSCAGVCNGACTDGRCLVTLARGAAAGELAVDGERAYFTSCASGSGAVLGVPLAGGLPELLAAVPGCPVGLALLGSSLYLTNVGPGGVFSLSLGGADGGTLTTLASAVGDPSGVAVDGTSVYFSTGSGNLEKVPLQGGEVTTLVSGRRRLTRPVVDETGVYFGDKDRGSIERVPLAGGAPSVVTSGVVALSALTLSRTDVYFGSGYLVMKAPRAGGPAVTLGTAAGAEVLAVAVDADSLYFSGYGSVWKMPLAGGQPVLLAPDQSEARAIVVDGTSVYWTNATAARPDAGDCCGTIMKLTPK